VTDSTPHSSQVPATGPAIGQDEWVARHAERRLARAARFAPENDFVAACLLRAGGRLHEDEHDLAASVAAWEAIGARFERACTLLLLPARHHEGAAELTALGSPLPAW